MEENLNFFNKNGYLHIKKFFLQKDVECILIDAKNIFFKQFLQKKYLKYDLKLKDIDEKQFNDYLFRLFEDDLGCLVNCGKQVQHLISLHRLSLNNKLISLINSLGLSTPVISTRPVLFYNHHKLAKKKVYHKVDAHQDWRSMQGSLNSLVVWVPLIDIDKSLGALEILPKSHLTGLQCDHLDSGFGMVKLSSSENEKLISVEVERGDILVFSSFLVHQSGNNVSSKPRWSCHFRYNDLDEETFLQRKYAHPYIYYPQEELITNDFPSLKQLKNTFS